MNSTDHRRGRPWVFSPLRRGFWLAPLLAAIIAPAQEIRLFSVTNWPWRYLANGSNQGTAWSQPGFPDNAWATGFGLFGFENSSNEYLPDFFRTFIAPPNQGGPVTVYFRTHFTWPQSPLSGVTLRASALLDDGAVFYLNGIEAGRLRVPPGQNFLTPADLQTFEGWPETVLFPDGLLRPGDNVLAVELHQNSNTSSDDVFGLSLTGTFPAPFISNQPTGQTVVEYEDVSLSVKAVGAPPLNYQWMQDGLDLTGETNATLTILEARSYRSGMYQVRIYNNYNEVWSDMVMVSVGPDNSPPVLVSAATLDGVHIGVCFNERVQPAMAVEASNWSVTGVMVLSAELQPNGKSVLLTLDQPPAILTVSLGRISDLSGNYNFNLATQIVGSVAGAMDVGSPPLSGSSFTCAVGDVDVVAGGADIWGNSDECYFVFQPLTGNFDVKARVQRLDAVNYFSKAGLMARESLAPDSKTIEAYTFPLPPDGVGTFEAGVRSANGGSTETWGGHPPTTLPNAWIRLHRLGQVFSAFFSGDGSNWTKYAQTDLSSTPLNQGLLVGLAVTSHDPTHTTTAEFRAFSSLSAPAILDDPQCFLADFTATVHFHVTAIGADSYQWFHDGVAVPGAIGPDLILTSVQPADVGIYCVQASNLVGTVKSAPGELQLLLNRGTTVVNGRAARDHLSDSLAGPAVQAKAAPAASPPGCSGPITPLTHGIPASFSNKSATANTNEPLHCGIPACHSMWCSYTAIETGLLRISTEGSDFDTVLATYTWDGNDTHPLAPVPGGCDNDSGRNKTSIVNFLATRGTTYYIAVDGFNCGTGRVRLEVGPALTFGLPRLLAGNQVEISLAGRAGQTYLIQGAAGPPAAPSAWPIVFSNTVPTNVARITNYFRTNFSATPRLLFIGKEVP